MVRASGAVILQSRASGVSFEAEHIGQIERLSNGTAGSTIVQLYILMYASQHQIEQQLVQLLVSALTVFR